MTSAKNKTASSVNTAVPPVIKMLDKAECDHHSVSHLLSPVFVRKEGEWEKSPNEPDFTTTDRPVAQTHWGVARGLGGDCPPPGFLDSEYLYRYAD